MAETPPDDLARLDEFLSERLDRTDESDGPWDHDLEQFYGYLTCAKAKALASLITTQAQRIEEQESENERLIAFLEDRIATEGKGDDGDLYAAGVRWLGTRLISLLSRPPAWRLSAEQSAAFAEALENPPAPNDALRRAAKQIEELTAERDEALSEPLIERLAYEASVWARDPAHNVGADQPLLVFARRFAFLLQRATRHDR